MAVGLSWTAVGRVVRERGARLAARHRRRADLQLAQPLPRVAGDPDLGPLKPARDHVQVRLCAAHTQVYFPLNTLNTETSFPLRSTQIKQARVAPKWGLNRPAGRQEAPVRAVYAPVPLPI